MKALRRKVALETHRQKAGLLAWPVELINADSTIQRNKTSAAASWKKVQWPGVPALLFATFPEGIVISKHARTRIRTVGCICAHALAVFHGH